MYADTCLLILVLLAVIFDLKDRRIPNLLILVGIVLAVSYQVYIDQFRGLLFCSQGLMTGIVLLLIPFVMGGLGAGDVKLLGMVGAFKGSIFAVQCFLWMAIWGGIIALILLVHQGRLLDTLTRLGRGVVLARLGAVSLSASLSSKEFSIHYPYGVAIALGVLTSYCKGWW